ncbi:MAG: hypothetical protein KIS66_17070 [Fimbriimonadaceae bacterium]|nr:hypothetical protein [Fimbriimonadaceae bacterium]
MPTDASHAEVLVRLGKPYQAALGGVLCVLGAGILAVCASRLYQTGFRDAPNILIGFVVLLIGSYFVLAWRFSRLVIEGPHLVVYGALERKYVLCPLDDIVALTESRVENGEQIYELHYGHQGLDLSENLPGFAEFQRVVKSLLAAKGLA